MNRPDFHQMSLGDLRAYVLAHQSDQRAFHIYVDRKIAEGNPVTYPPLESVEDMENYPDIIAKLRQAEQGK
ncbi:MAG: hypothetical protein VKL39_03825 [Leptolyngbyaceae bacterium]|nr:hypothetical protein [Leptolyngbyaceae bacterium]